MIGLRAEKHDLDIWFRDAEGNRCYAVGNVANAEIDRAAAVVYEPLPRPSPPGWAGVRVDRWGTEVWPTLVGAPGYWCWLLDLAIEAGFEPMEA